MGFHSFSVVGGFLVLLCNIVLVSSTCYNPDGTAKTSPAYQPCVQTEGTFSQCCGTNWTATDPRIANDQCMANGLCLNNNPDDNEPLYWRGSCTDPTWKSPFCLSSLCTNSSNGGNASDNVPLIQCTDGSWCCGSANSTCCKEGLGVKIDTIVGVANQSSSTSSISSATATSSSSTATSLASSATGSLSPSPSSTDSGTSTGAKAGIGIGVGLLAVIALAGIIWFIMRRRKRNQAGSVGSSGSTGGFMGTAPQELQGQGRTAYTEMGSVKPEPYQHEVEGYVPVPVHELPSSRYN